MPLSPFYNFISLPIIILYFLFFYNEENCLPPL
jgi:hypothetical protein